MSQHEDHISKNPEDPPNGKTFVVLNEEKG